MKNKNHIKPEIVSIHVFPDSSLTFYNEESKAKPFGISSQQALEKWRNGAIICNRWFKFLNDDDIDIE